MNEWVSEPSESDSERSLTSENEFRESFWLIKN